MKKSELKTGYIVKARNGEIGLVMLNSAYGSDVIVGDGSDRRNQFWGVLENYNEDLTNKDFNNREYDIDEVYGWNSNSNSANVSINNRKLLWKRENFDIFPKLTEEYDAKIFYDKKLVEIHDTKIPFDKIEEIYKCIKSAQPYSGLGNLYFEVKEQYQYNTLISLAKSKPNISIGPNFLKCDWREFPYFMFSPDKYLGYHVTGSSSTANATSIPFMDMLRVIDNNQPSTIELNGQYNAVILFDRKMVKVGCQTITFEKVKELREFINKK